MLNKGVIYLLIIGLALLASPGLARPVSAALTLVVDDNGLDCTDVGYASITAALTVAADGDTVQVCAGNYTEQPVVTHSVIITGPGATSEDDGVATVHHNGGISAMFTIQADWVTVEGLDLDATPAGGVNTTGFEINAPSVTIQKNEIHNATSSAVSPFGAARYVRVINNNIHDSLDGVVCSVEDCVVAGNTISVTDRAVDIVGNGGNITDNTVIHGRIDASGDSLFISLNDISGPAAGTYLMSVNGSFIGIVENTFSDSAGYGIKVEPGAADTSVTITHNTFTRLEHAIYLYDGDPSDGAMVVATIGGSPGEGNTFVDSGGSLGDSNYLLWLDGPTLAVDAEYNNWGLCGPDEIEQEIRHQVDNPALGLVDFDPLIAPASCSATPAPTPTPTATPTATPGPTATPKPGDTRTVTIPAGSWANFAWTGDSTPQTVADCFGAGNIAVMYRLDSATQTFQRWISGRDELSNMSDVLSFDSLLALNAGPQPAACTMPLGLPGSVATILPAGGWANFAWQGNVALPAEAVAEVCGIGSIAVMYRLDAATQTFQRWVRGRPELSNMTDVQPYDALLARNGSDQPATCTFPVFVM